MNTRRQNNRRISRAAEKKTPSSEASAKKMEAPNPSSWRNWSNHPIVILVGACSATAITVAALFQQIIVPTELSLLKKENEQKRSDLEAAEKIKQDLANANSKVETQADDITSLRRQIEEYRHREFLSPNDPYPILLKSVRVGDTIQSVETIKVQAIELKKKEGYWNLIFPHDSVLDEATFYYRDSDQSTKNVITHIVYRIRNDSSLTDKFLYDRLSKSLGTPSISKRDKNSFHWQTKDAEIYLMESKRYFVMKRGLAPILWKR